MGTPSSISTICQSAEYIFVFKFERFIYLFSLKNSCPCRDLNPGLPRYQADMLPIELSWLGSVSHFHFKFYLIHNSQLFTIINFYFTSAQMQSYIVIFTCGHPCRLVLRLFLINCLKIPNFSDILLVFRL